MIGLKATTEDDLTPEIIAYAIPPFVGTGRRAQPILRIRRVGIVFFVEGMRGVRTDGAGITPEWKVIAVSKHDPRKHETPDDARAQAFGFMGAANAEALAMSKAKKS